MRSSAAPTLLGHAALALAAMGMQFLLFSAVRGMAEQFGFSLVHALIAMAMAGGFVVAPLWTASVAFIALRAALAHRRRAARLRAGACTQCGYQLTPDTTVCPECGATGPQEPPGPTPARAAWLLATTLIAAAIGAAAGESLIQWDEHAFRREAAAWESAGGTGMYARNRCWPNASSALLYEPGKGFRATD